MNLTNHRLLATAALFVATASAACGGNKVVTAPPRAGYRVKGPVTGPPERAPTGYRFELVRGCSHRETDCPWVLVHIASGAGGSAPAADTSASAPAPRQVRPVIRKKRAPAPPPAPRPKVDNGRWEQVRTSGALLTPAGRAAKRAGKPIPGATTGSAEKTTSNLECPKGYSKKCGQLQNCQNKGGRCVFRSGTRCWRRMYHRICRRRCTCKR